MAHRQWFEPRFMNTFTDTTKTIDAVAQMQALKMSGNDLDSYIATFDRYRNMAGWGENDASTIQAFM
jgi:hypothetical protein